MNTPALVNGQSPIQTMPHELVIIDSEDESEGEDALPTRVNGVNHVDQLVDADEVGESSDDESDNGWDIESLIEDAIDEMSDEQLVSGSKCSAITVKRDTLKIDD
jgi:hypothetical protein